MVKDSDIDEVKRLLKRRVMPVLSSKDFVSLGSTPLNLGCSGRASGGFAKGSFNLFVGTTNSGKTVISLSMLAEAGINKYFNDYRMIYDGPEFGALMDMRKFYGPAVVERLEPPLRVKGTPIHSSTIEEFYYHADSAFTNKKPCLYILDSIDALGSKASEKKFYQYQRAYLRGVEGEATDKLKGEMTDGKAKVNSQMLRRLLTPLQKSGSILLIINQTRANMGFGSQYQPDTHSGGNALEFYAQVVLWSKVKEKLYASVKGTGKSVHIGTRCRVTVKRSRVTGRERVVDVPIYFSAGVDDLGSCVDYLVEWKHWKARKSEEDGKGYSGPITVPEWKVSLPREDLVAYVEEGGLEKELRATVASVWANVEKECAVTRKNRYQ